MRQAPHLLSPGGLGLILCAPPPPATTASPATNGSTRGSKSLVDGENGRRPFGTTKGITNWLWQTAAAADEAGAGAIWTVDHLYWRHPIIECLTSLAVVAAATERAAIGSCVLQLPLRSSHAVAKQAASLQQLADGRLVLGVGAGSHPGEYDLAGVDFASRGRRLDSGLAELRHAWAIEGEYRIDPQGAPVPVWVGGSSPAARRRAARAGDGWIPLFVDATELAGHYRQLDDEAAAAGRRPSDIARSVVVPVTVNAPGDGGHAGTTERGCRWLADLYGIPPKAFERHLVAGSLAQCAEGIAAYREAGASHVALFITSTDPIEQFAPLARALAQGPVAGPAPAGAPVEAVVAPRQTPGRAELAGVGA